MKVANIRQEMREKTLMYGKRTKNDKNITRTKRKPSKSLITKDMIGTVLSLYHRSHRDLLKLHILGANQYKIKDKGRSAYHLYRYSRIVRLCVGLFKMVKYGASCCVLIVRLIGRKVFV